MREISSPVAATGEGIVDAFARLVEQRSTEGMVVSPGRRSTFGDVDTLAQDVSDRVATVGLQRGTLVGLAAGSGPAFFAGLLALRRLGIAVLLLDPLAPVEDRRRAARSLGANAVLDCVDGWPSSGAAFHIHRIQPPVAMRSRADVAIVKLTSGSTGAPRGVAMCSEHVLADEAALAHTMGLRATDRLLAAIPLSHSYGFTTLALSALVRGLTLVVPADRGPFSSLAAARTLQATVFPTIPAYIQALLKLTPPPSWPESIRLVISAGAFLPSATAAKFREVYGQPVHAFYGASECGGICYDREGGAAERGTVGTPVEGVRLSLRAVDPEAPEEGVITVESSGVGATYLPEPDSRLGAGSFATSDIGVWEGDEVVLRRRVDRVINVRGRKVDPGEVERVLADIDGVDEVVVIGVPGPTGDEIVRAIVAGPLARRLHYRDVAVWCRQRLADHKVPRSVVFLEAIPRTSRGKVDRAALVALVPSDVDPVPTHE